MKHLLLLLAVSFCLVSVQAQPEKKQEAKEFFFHQRYSEALAVLNSTRGLVNSDQEARFLQAVCLYNLNHLDEALALFQQQIKEDKAPYPECWFYQAKAYHAMHQFGKAAESYKDYLRRLKNNHPNRQIAWEEVRRCAKGMDLQYKPSEAGVENMGPEVNTAHDEFAPVLSQNFSNKLYFSSIRPGNMGGRRNVNGLPDNRLGQYFSDMFSTEVVGVGQWGKAQAMHHLLNSPQHEILLGFNQDGSALYYFKGWAPETGQILIDTFRKIEERTLTSDPFRGPMNTALGDGTPFFFNDTLLYFSSRRPGGYGGLDLYYSSYSKGRWSAPKNLGPVINTAYDETTPFLARDGKTLYFSSNNSSRSLGGLDVLKAVYNGRAQRWTEPENLGMPINSAGDDAYFRIAKDGFTAYFSSSRKDSYGQRDLYIAYFNHFLPEMELVMPVPPTPPPYAEAEATPKVQETISQSRENLATEVPESQATPTAEPTGGSSANAFPPFYFQATDRVLDADQKTQLDKIASLMQETPGLHLIITAYHTGQLPLSKRLFQGIKQAEIAAGYLMQKGINGTQIFMRCGDAKGFNLRSGHYSLEFSFKKPEDAPESLVVPTLETGLSSAIPSHALNKNLLYKVQIYSLSGEFRGSLLEEYPDAMIEKEPNLAYYRYTLGAFTRYADAEAFRQQLIEAGQRSAFVVPYIYGLRADKMMARRHIIYFPDLQHYAN
ncbi:MAG: PD40 domain-containing protein [Phaeodactylibacter sp.]|nr:PD40 domain-containing protein [Phaeodactylibacter sp.]MCB9053037.1 PD40 domain-containing protein [Lewinellaceae bacterium]